MEAFDVLNGTYGEVWLDSDKVAEITSLQAKIDFKKEDVPICGRGGTAKKVVGWDGKGSFKMHKVNSRMAKKLRSLAKDGINLSFTIISKITDKDTEKYGAERVVLKDIMFDDLTLSDWEHGKLGQVECPFTFSDYDYLDMID